MFIGLCEIGDTSIIFEGELISNLRLPCAFIIQCNSVKGEEEIGSMSGINNDVCDLEVLIYF